MGDTWIDATQSYENETTSTEITNVDNDDLLTPPETSDANYLIKLVNDAPTNTNNLYILQASTNGEIRFLTKEAYLNNDVSANDGNLYYNTKIGKDGKLYLYWTYNFLSNPLRFSGWYDINDEIAGHGNQLTLLEAGAIALEAQVAIANVNITGLNTTLNATITSQNAINASVNTLLNQHTTEIGALATQTAVLPTLQQYFNGSAFVAGSRKGIAGLWRRTNWTSAQTTIAQRYTSRVVQGRQGSVLTAERTLTAPALNSFELLSNTASVATNKAIGDISTAFGIVGAGAILAGIYRYYTNANEEQRNDLIKDLIETKEDMILQQAQTANPYYTTKNRISKAGLVIDETTNNAYGGAVGVYEVEGLTQYAGVILNMEIYLDTGVKKARIINVVAGGSRTWVVGDQIQIPKSTKLGGYVAGAGTIDLLKINVSVIYNPLEAVDITINDLLTEQGEEDRRNRRRKGVIGVNEISDTNAFALTTETETNTITGESITYNTLKSRINLLPTGTNDVDIYTSTGKVGIGTIASSTLHLYNATAPSIRLETATAGASSIVFQRGATNDVSNDFRIINESDELKFQYQDNLVNFGTASDIIRVNDKRTQFVKDGYFSEYVGIGMLPDVDRLSITGDTYMNGSLGINTPTGSYTFDMLGDARIDGNMGIGAGAPAGVRLYVAGATQLGGNVGIGISPTIGSALNVNGDINIASGTNYKIGGLLLSYNNLNNKLSAGTGISISTATTPVISATYTSTNLIGIFNSTQFENVSSVIQVKTGGISYNNLANKLVAGTNITIDAATNIISSTGSSTGGGLSQGMVVQMKHLTYTQMDVKNNTGWDAINDNLTTGFVIAITPTSTSSKILVNMIAHIGTGYTTDSRWWGIKLYRKIGAGGAWTEITGANGTETGAAAATQGTPVWVSHNLGSSGADYQYFIANVAGTYMDAPNTTSIVYYTAYWNCRIGDPNAVNNGIWINRVETHSDAYRTAPSSSWTATEIWDLGTPYVPPVGDNTITISSGNVGVGTGANASYKLNVGGAINALQKIDIQGTNPTLRLLDTNSDGNAIIQFRELNDFYGMDIAYIGNTDNKMYIRSYNNSATPVNNITIDRGSGYIGLGTTNPIYKFHIKCTYDNASTGIHLDAGETDTATNKYTLNISPYVIAGGEVGWRFRTQNFTGGTYTPLTLNNYGDVAIARNISAGGAIYTDNSYMLAKEVYARNSFDTRIRSDSGGMYLEMGYVGSAGGLLKIGAYASATNIDSGESRNIIMRTGGGVWVYTPYNGSFNAAGSIYWTNPSDHRIKENIKKANLKMCYDNIKNINLYRFNYIDGYKKATQYDKTQLGFIAQQVKQHYPKSIRREKMRFEDKREVPDLSVIDVAQVNYSLFGAVKQLMRVVEKQSKRIKKLEEMLNIIDDDEVEDDADEPYERIVCDEVDIDDIEPSEPTGV